MHLSIAPITLQIKKKTINKKLCKAVVTIIASYHHFVTDIMSEYI